MGDDNGVTKDAEEAIATNNELEDNEGDEAGSVNVPESPAQMPETNTTEHDVNSSTKKNRTNNRNPKPERAESEKSPASPYQINSMQQLPLLNIASGNSFESVSRKDLDDPKNERKQKIESLATKADENSSLETEKENSSKLENEVKIDGLVPLAQLNDKLDSQDQKVKKWNQDVEAQEKLFQNWINNLENRLKATEERVEVCTKKVSSEFDELKKEEKEWRNGVDLEIKSLSSKVSWIMYINCIFIAVCAVYFGLNSQRFATKPQIAPVPKIEFTWKHVEQFLDKSYPQLAKTENVISTLDLAYHRWFKRDDEPVVLIIAGNSSGQFLENLTSFTSRKVLRQSSTIYVDSNTAKADLYGMFDTALGGSNDITVAGVRGIEKLVWDAPLVLHAIVDGANSPYPKALILLAIEEEIKGDCEQGIEKLLNSRWMSSGGTGDNVSPILARIQQFHICI